MVVVGVGLARWDGLAGVGWSCPGARSRVGFGDGLPGAPVRGAVAVAACGLGDGSAFGFSGRVGGLLCGLVALAGGSVPVQAARLQPPASEPGE